MNRLAETSSPYLLQHAENPVDWYPWCDEALAIARKENKPILLSIGYSACHWCHVMAHESFCDPKVAAVMNQHFINIKVDREERPDLDKIYQTAHQLLARQRGGWPLTVFLTPADQIPFFSGTYFPPQERYGLPGFIELLQHVATYYQKHHDDIQKQNVRLRMAMMALSELPETLNVRLSSDPMRAALQHLIENFDPLNGGFYTAPKFPHPTALAFLLHLQAGNGLEVAKITLLQMAKSGIYDHLGGGFFRYAVDEAWQIPHFEKMLYDNALLLNVFVDASLLWNDPIFKRIAVQTGEWVLRDMQALNGAYYSSLDADSDGIEGKFYVWDKENLKSLLSEQEYEIFAAFYGLNNPPNFEGHYHLTQQTSIEELGKKMNLSVDQLNGLLANAKQKCFIARSQKRHPERDSKQLTAWNSLMIKAMAKAGLHLQREDFIQSARYAVNFILDNLWRDGCLHVTYHQGQVQQRGFLDDYAFLLDALLTLLQVEWDERYFAMAKRLADILLAEFIDTEKGGFFFTGHYHETLIARLKTWVDEALPAGNAVAIIALQRLGHLLGETRYLEAAEKALQAIAETLQQNPAGHYCLLDALAEYLKPCEMVVLFGEETKIWLTACQQGFYPHRLVFAIPDTAQDLPVVLHKPIKQGTAAIVCRGTQCSAPITDLAKLQDYLASDVP